MLGIVRSVANWQWAVYGKHPLSRDFINFGSDFPLMKGLSHWIESGYSLLTSQNTLNKAGCSWRFWMKGNRKETLICGLVKDSSDKLGRPYPLLIMGTGFVENWENQWDFLPFACEQTWNQMEYLSAQMYSDIKKLESELYKIRVPCSEWADFKKKREHFITSQNSIGEQPSLVPQNIEDRITEFSRKEEGIICLDNEQFYNQSVQINLFHFFMKANLKIIPNVIFMGGTSEKAYVVFFKRPLAKSDFVALWLQHFKI